MQLIAVESAADTAEVIVEIVTRRPPRRLGVATGSSPEPAFRALARAQVLSLQTELYLVDEYVGLAPDSPGRYSHSPDEVLDLRDLDNLVRRVVAVAFSGDRSLFRAACP